MTCSRSFTRALFFAALFGAALCGALSTGHASAAPPPVYLPLVQPNLPPSPVLGPPVAVQVRADYLTVTAGQPVTLTATLLDAAGNALPTASDLRVFLSVGGRDLLVDRMATAAGPAGYTAHWLPPAAGHYTVGAVVAQATDGAKTAIPGATFAFTVEPGPGVALDLTAHTFAAIALPDFLVVTLYDTAGNALPDPPPSSVSCTSDHTAIEAGAAQPLPADFYRGVYDIGLGSSHQLGIPLTATGYGVATIICTHGPSGATDTETVAAAPWEMRWGELGADAAVTAVPAKQFETIVSTRVPSGTEWNRLVLDMEWPAVQHVLHSGWGTLLPPDNVSTSETEEGGRYKHRITLPSNSTYSGTLAAIRGVWQVHYYVSPAVVPTPLDFKVTGFTLSSPHGNIIYDPAPFDPWRTITVTVMLTESLPVHLYVVAGAADPGDVEAGVSLAKRALAVNRGDCLPAFHVQAQVTEVPAAAWATLDPDGDGFDRWDANGDGVFAGAADGDDFAVAAAAGYADTAPGTVNVYYVPQVRGAPALAAAGNALALERTAGDDWALFHLLAHALDLRTDGDRDLMHGPRAPGNALGDDLPGPFLTPEQCAALNP